LIITDTHTHLYSDQLREDLPQLIDTAVQSGVSRFFMPNIDSSSIDAMLALEKQFPGKCFSMMGLHPCSVNEKWIDEMKFVEDWLSRRSFCAVGEIGIDLYWDKTFIEEQKIVFNRQIELANQYKLPVVIHTRDSFDITIGLLSKLKKEEPCGIFHCFTGNADQAKQVIDMGFYLGIGGVVTFKNGGLDQVLPQTDLKHIVLETDAPYLAPVPYRGKRNEPVYIVKVAEKIAELKNITVEEVARITTENAKRIFNM
jgi:TatD DNase family protein